MSNTEMFANKEAFKVLLELLGLIKNKTISPKEGNRISSIIGKAQKLIEKGLKEFKKSNGLSSIDKYESDAMVLIDEAKLKLEEMKNN